MALSQIFVGKRPRDFEGRPLSTGISFRCIPPKEKKREKEREREGGGGREIASNISVMFKTRCRILASLEGREAAYILLCKNAPYFFFRRRNFRANE